MKKRDLFSDPYESLVDKPSASEKVVVPDAESHVTVTYKNKQTGAEYLVKTNKVNGPQGDFRISSKDAEDRFRLVMGYGSERQQRPDNPFEEDRLRPERMNIASEVQNYARDRDSADVRLYESTAMTKEPLINQEWEDMGTYSVDPNGRIRDKPNMTQGPFHTEEKRSEFKSLPESDLVVRTNGKEVSAHAVIKRSTDIEKKVGEDRGLQYLINCTFRALFGSVQKSSEERPVQSQRTIDRVFTSRAVLESGLMKAWNPSQSSDRPTKSEDIEMAVGRRALDALPKGTLRSEIADTNPENREAMTIALGRTILNALSASPQQDRSTPELKLRDEVVQNILSTLSPAMYKGIIPSDILDSQIKSDVQPARVAGSSKNEKLGQRIASSTPKTFDEPMTIGQRGSLSFSSYRDPFNNAESNDREELAPNRHIKSIGRYS